MSHNEIAHSGRIVSIADGKISVEIVSMSACSSCHAAGLCGASESEKKIIQVTDNGADTHYVGEEVVVCLGKSLGLKAVLISYVVPVMILLILIVTLSLLEKSEILTGMVAIGGVVLYYLAVYLFRAKIAGKYEFYIRK